jgi:glycerophosphoryl diester phosphodiesterase
MWKNKPLVIAHRGAKDLAPENTIEAFKKALELGADGIELDTMLSADKVPVVTHNDDLSILTGHKGYVHEMPISTIKGLDIGSHFDASFSGTRIPLLDEAFDLLADRGILLIVEIKGQLGLFSESAKIIGQKIAARKFGGRVVVSSTNIQVLRTLHSLHPSIDRAIIIPHKAFSFFIPELFAKIGTMQGIHPSVSAVSHRLVRLARQRGCEVDVWTVNDDSSMKRCIELGVDGIMTDSLSFARSCIT